MRHGDEVVQHADEAFTFVNWADNAADGRRAAGSSDSVVRQGDHAEEIRVTGECSFSWNTPVATTEGQVPISEIDSGDLVLAYHEGLRTTGFYTVTATWTHDDPVIITITLDGEEIETTPEHPFYVLLRGWVPAEDLHAGDAVRRANGTYGRVDNVRIERRTQRMYNLTIADAHTFFVGEGEWLVHNTCRAFPGGTPSPFGQRLADLADGFYSKLGFWEKNHTTIAVTEINGRLYVTVNGNADKRAIPKIEAAVNEAGGTFISNPNGKESHAERFLYETLDGTPTAIGVSHRKGPCEELCQPYFQDLGVEISFNDNWK